MPEHAVHCADCIRELGEAFAHVHIWLDAYATVYGPAHRDIRHHDAGVDRVRQMWGDAAAMAAVIHIRADYGGKLPTVAEARVWACLNPAAAGRLDAEFPKQEKSA